MGWTAPAVWTTGEIVTATKMTQQVSDNMTVLAMAAQGSIIYRNATIPAELAAGNKGEFLQTGGAGANPAWAALSRKNGVINGNFIVSQRGTSFTSATTVVNSDDTYLFDRWILLSDGNDIVDVSQETTVVPTGAYSAACFDIETEDKKWGIIQILEAKDSAAFIGGTVSLSFKARMGASDTSTLLRAAVLSWSSTADTVTSDVVNDWGAEGTNPTVVANWTLENTPAALAALTATYQTYKIEGISIDTASTTNIAVFIWSDDMTNAVGDLVYITDVQLELGSVATPFEFSSITNTIALCQRFYMSYGGANAYEAFASGVVSGATTSDCLIYLPTTMRIVPALAISNVGDFIINDGVASLSPSAIAINVATTKIPMVRFTDNTASLTVGNAARIYADNTTAARLMFSAEL